MDKSVTYLLIEPAEQRATTRRFNSLDEACRAVGLSRDQVDHGSLGQGQSIVVYEYGLRRPIEQQHLFALRQNLYEGNAVIYAEDIEGRRVDVDQTPIPRWFKNVDEVWEAIEQGDVIQPSMAINGEVLWLWPDATMR